MNTPQIKHEKGFTIIEVVLVLAIAGLIFLMVFVALPSLQRGQRDAQRKQDLARISTQLTNYVSSTRGAVPDDRQSLGAFVKNYLDGKDNSTKVAGDEYKDPSGENYVVDYEGTPNNQGEIRYFYKSKCKDDGSGTTDKTTASRDFALIMKLENQKAPYCVDNRS